MQRFRPTLNYETHEVILGESFSLNLFSLWGLSSSLYFSTTRLSRDVGGIATSMWSECLSMSQQGCRNNQRSASWHGNVWKWVRANKLKFNPDQTEMPPGTLGRDTWLRNGGISFVFLVKVAVNLKEQICSWETQLDLDFLLAEVVKGAFWQLWQVSQLRPSQHVGDLATVMHALVASRECYTRRCPWIGQAEYWLKGDHITPVLFHLHFLFVCFQAQFKVLVLTGKALYSLDQCILRTVFFHINLPISFGHLQSVPIIWS